MAEQARQFDALQQRKADLETARAAARAAAPIAAGTTAAVETSANRSDTPAESAAGDVIAQWNQQLAKMEAKLGDRAKAIRAMAQQRPDLHRAYLAAYTAVHTRRG